jgi:hypothetical protein
MGLARPKPETTLEPVRSVRCAFTSEARRVD